MSRTDPFVFSNLTGLSRGTTYYYRVVAANISGTAYGNIMSFTTLLEAPSNLTATAISENQIDLSWTDNSDNETGFEIERKTGLGGTYQQVATTAANITTYSNTGLTAGTTYYYRISAYNSNSNSAYSNEAGVVTMATPPTATTNAATNINGNSVTLNGSVNANGADTTIYFQWGTTTSYGNTTTTQSIGNGTNNLVVSVNVFGLIPGTSYNYRVVATNGGGTSYGENMNFTTPPIIITYPLNGATISRSDVMVRGTIINTTGTETGITVNGIVATVYGTQFIANHIPLIEGLNPITVTSKDTTGNTSTASITINALTTLPHVTLRANIESGISPLTTYFSVSTEIPNSVSSYALDYEGDGIDDNTGTTFDDISITYQAEGIYYPTVTVTDNKGLTYSDTIAIVVLNATDLDALLRGKWNFMTNSLFSGDIASALTQISSGTRASYQAMFNYLIAQLPSIVATQTEFNLVSISDNVAKFELVTIESGTTYSYEVVFIKDNSGIWMIENF